MAPAGLSVIIVNWRAARRETSKAARQLRKCLEMNPPADIYHMAEKDLHKLEEP